MDAGYLATWIGADPKRVEEAIKVTVEEYAKITVKGEVTEEELTKAKEFMKGHFVLGLEDTRTIAVMYGSQEILEHHLTDPKDIMAKVDAVTLDDIHRVAKEYLDTKAMSLAMIGNFEEPEKFERLLK